MTRLISADLAGLGDRAAYDSLIQAALGVDLLTLGARAADLPPPLVAERLRGLRLASLSVSSGEGILPGFAETLAAIGRGLGLCAAAMPSPDEEGLREAEAWGAEWVIRADDACFEVLVLPDRVLPDRVLADNNPATSRAFVAALELLAGFSLAGREVLVLGLGVIGRGAAARLLELGAWPLMYDADPAKGPAALAEVGGGEVVAEPQPLVLSGRVPLIFEAVPSKEIWKGGLPEKTRLRVAAPGVPLSWPKTWLRPGGPSRLWHDVLPSGVAAMLAMAAGASSDIKRPASPAG